MKIFLEQLSQILIDAGIAQGCFVALLLNNKSVRRSRANLFLSILLLAMAFSVLHMRYAGMVLEHFSIQAYHLGDPTFFLIAPLLWFYAKELTGDKVKRSHSLILHFLPFVVLIFFSLLLKVFAPDHPLIIHLNGNQRWLLVFFWIVVVIQFSCYLFFVHKKWLTYGQLIEQEVSNTENVKISWVRFFMGVFLFINVFFLLTLITLVHLGNRSWLANTIPVIFSLSIFALGYKGILQKEIFYQHSVENALTPSPVMLVKKTDQELLNKLYRYMEEQQPYLDPELTLSSLARDLNLGRSLLSQLINEGAGAVRHKAWYWLTTSSLDFFCQTLHPQGVRYGPD